MSDLRDVVGRCHTSIYFLADPDGGYQDQGDRYAVFFSGDRCQQDEGKDDTACTKQNGFRLKQIVHKTSDYSGGNDDGDESVMIFLLKNRTKQQDVHHVAGQMTVAVVTKDMTNQSDICHWFQK